MRNKPVAELEGGGLLYSVDLETGEDSPLDPDELIKIEADIREYDAECHAIASKWTKQELLDDLNARRKKNGVPQLSMEAFGP